MRIRILLALADGDLKALDQLVDAELRGHELAVGKVVLIAAVFDLVKSLLQGLDLHDAGLVKVLELAELRDEIVLVVLHRVRGFKAAADAHNGIVGRMQHHEREPGLGPRFLRLLHALLHLHDLVHPELVNAEDLVQPLLQLFFGISIGGIAALFQFFGQTIHNEASSIFHQLSLPYFTINRRTLQPGIDAFVKKVFNRCINR